MVRKAVLDLQQHPRHHQQQELQPVSHGKDHITSLPGGRPRYGSRKIFFQRMWDRLHVDDTNTSGNGNGTDQESQQPSGDDSADSNGDTTSNFAVGDATDGCNSVSSGVDRSIGGPIDTTTTTGNPSPASTSATATAAAAVAIGTDKPREVSYNNTDDDETAVILTGGNNTTVKRVEDETLVGCASLAMTTTSATAAGTGINVSINSTDSSIGNIGIKRKRDDLFM